MKNIVGLIALSISLVSCGNNGGGNGGHDDSPPVSNDLATAPLGGEYYGEITLQTNTCEDPEPGSEAFEPFKAKAVFYPENEEQSSLTFIIGDINIEEVKPKDEGEYRYLIDHQAYQEDLYTYDFKMKGSVERGDLVLDFYEDIYGGPKEDLGQKICDASFKFHMKKIVNYPYVSSPPKASKVMVGERTFRLIQPFSD